MLILISEKQWFNGRFRKHSQFQFKYYFSCASQLKETMTSKFMSMYVSQPEMVGDTQLKRYHLSGDVSKALVIYEMYFPCNVI